jgi:hypothetical protein
MVASNEIKLKFHQQEKTKKQQSYMYTAVKLLGWVE